MASATETTKRAVEPLPPALLSRNPLAWLTVFGPGAIIASLTIGTGELIFSTRGGAIFGYRILFLFVVISILKWALVFGMSRHMVLTGVHPYRRMMDLPGPRGWFPLMLLMMAAVAMPVWVGFHSSVLGNLTSHVTGTGEHFNGGIDYLWGAAILAAIVILSATGGYSALERIQLAIVSALVICAGISLILYNPDWWEMLKGAVIPQLYEYPEWLRHSAEYKEIAEQPVWVETTRYVGVIGGAAYDYLAYTAFLRDKHWGRAALEPATEADLQEMAEDRSHPVRSWVRAPLIDCTLSFIVVVAFSAVFVASGAISLGPEQKVPNEKNMLTLQAQFVTKIDPRLLPLYISGAYLTMLGTLYGTFEVAHTILDEIIRAFRPDVAQRKARRIKFLNVAWCTAGACLVLGSSFLFQLRGAGDEPRMMLAILTPVNLFTGVLACGLFCAVIVWMEYRYLPTPLRMSWPLIGLNILAAVVFLVLGLKGYWDLGWNLQKGLLDPDDLRSRMVVTGCIGMLALPFLSAAIAAYLGKRSGRRLLTSESESD